MPTRNLIIFFSFRSASFFIAHKFLVFSSCYSAISNHHYKTSFLAVATLSFAHVACLCCRVFILASALFLFVWQNSYLSYTVYSNLDQSFFAPSYKVLKRLSDTCKQQLLLIYLLILFFFFLIFFFFY